MIHSIFNKAYESEIQIIDDNNTNISVSITSPTGTQEQILNKRDLSDFIGALLHVQSKINKRK